ncbi:MAG: VOC family protein [Acidobacteria bacterium]|nr:VOC family protein [Acidobacteriota bacterium]MCI0658657.1 VOC family protein [Acidobacteriota bacterium]
MSDKTKIHVHLTASNLQLSKEFYTRLFGVGPVKEKPDYAKFLPDLGPLNLAISQGAPSPKDARAHHLGIQVDSSEIVRRELERVQKLGISVRVELNTTCCYANQDKFWVVDPDGVEWEIYHLNYDVGERKSEAVSKCC